MKKINYINNHVLALFDILILTENFLRTKDYFSGKQ